MNNNQLVFILFLLLYVCIKPVVSTIFDNKHTLSLEELGNYLKLDISSSDDFPAVNDAGLPPTSLSGLSTTHNSFESPGCPSNRSEASEIGRQCSRKCRQDVPCDNVRKHCLCDGICGWSCLKPDLNCQELIKPNNGFFHPSSNVLNTRVRYECDSGYYLFGPRERICQGDEEWSGFTPECLPEAACKAGPKVAHARNPNEGYYRVGDSVIYTCYSGYDSHGSNKTVCTLSADNTSTAWIWSGDEFRCIPKSCGDPGQLENGRRHGDSFIVASTVIFSCNEGWQMLGQARRYCQSDGRWSGQQPLCEPVVCDPTDHLENGRISYINPLIFNSSVEYACDYGFRLVGPKYRRCGPDKKLMGESPHCEEIDCGDLGPLYNGYIRGFNSKIGDKKHFSCQEGTKFVGESNETICLDTGEWSHPKPLCLGGCVVPEIEHASHISVVTLATTTTTTTTSSSTANTVISNNNNNTLLASSVSDKIHLATHTDKANNGGGEPVKSGSLINHGRSLDIRCNSQFEPDEQVNQDGVIGPPTCENSTWTCTPRCVPGKSD